MKSRHIPKSTEHVVRRVIRAPDYMFNVGASDVRVVLWDGHDLAPHLVGLERSDARFRLCFEGSASVLGRLLSAPEIALSVRLKDGRKLLIEIAQILRFAFRSGGYRVELEAVDWSCINQRAAQRYWIVDVLTPRSIPFMGAGNLSVYTRTSATRGHYLFRGDYDYYLLNPANSHKQGKPFVLLIDTGKRRFDPQKLFEDLIILQFILGYPVEAHEVAQLSASGQVVGGRSLLSRKGVLYADMRWRPVEWEAQDGVWAAAFFDACSRFKRRRSRAALLVPMTLVIDTAAASVDAKYLAAHAALDSVTAWLPRSNGAAGTGEHLLVQDSRAWNTWVNDHRAEIEACALPDPAHRQKLVGRVRSAARADRSGMERRFREAGLSWIREMADAVDRRNNVVHRGKMREHRRNRAAWNTDTRRLGLVWTMLTAALARTIGFEGPIVDQRRFLADGFVVRPKWWTISDAAKTGLASAQWHAGPRAEFLRRFRGHTLSA